MIEKKTLVFVHGWGMHAGYWKYILPLLKKDYNVVCIDLPGHGKRLSDVCPSDLKKLTDQLAQETMELDSATWIGWSLGGLLALAMSFYHASRVKNLVMVGAMPRFFPMGLNNDHAEALSSNMLDNFKSLLLVSPEKALQRLTALLVRGEIQSSVVRKKLTLCMKEYAPASATTLRNGLSILCDSNLQKEASHIMQPTLLLSGENDYFFEHKHMRIAASLFQKGRLEYVSGSGHAPFVSHPDIFVDELTNFINTENG